MALNGKTAVVTGAARGIGRAYVERLAADGANVVAIDKEEPSELLAGLAGPGEKAVTACDVADPEQIEKVGAAVLERFGRVDIFVNKAAYMPTRRWRR